jgi:hypothetical protein
MDAPEYLATKPRERTQNIQYTELTERKIRLKFKCNRIILNCINIFGGERENRFPEVFPKSRTRKKSWSK